MNGNCSNIDKEIGELPAATSSIQVNNDQELRVPCYCEENVWRLAYRRHNNRIKVDLTTEEQIEVPSIFDYVAFISNPIKSCPMYCQKARVNECCVWDYHVILISSSKDINVCEAPDNDKDVANSKSNNDETTKITVTNVHDIDSVLPYPCPLNEYLRKAFCFLFSDQIEDQCKSKYAPMFRYVKPLLKYFSMNN